ncbi:MAG: hypothetical protein KIT31_34840, partial [Deltaproteobacteria bacterium]|nr:hypothetical protein [Deltaproteobacteria bacterium]
LPPFPVPQVAESVSLPPPPVLETKQEKRDKEWALYEKLGLGKPKLSAKNVASWIVNAYRMLGFAILTIIVIVLVGYITQTAFFYFSNSWVVPMAVSPTDEKVVTLQGQLAEALNSRDRLADGLKQAERAILVQQRFQAEFAKAIKSDLEGRRLALGKIRTLANAAAATRAAIRGQNSAYAAASQRRMKQEYAAGLIDRTSMMSGNFQLAQITSSNLTIAERQAEFELRAQELEATTRSLDAILSNAEGNANDTALSYEVLRIKQEYEASKLDLAKAVEARNTLKTNLDRQDKIVSGLKSSSHLRALNDGAVVAFVPYGNLSKVSKGVSLYGCKIGMVMCHHVGEVLEVLPGEVQFKHPHRDRMLRGQMVELRLDPEDGDAATDDVLFVGGKPILF